MIRFTQCLLVALLCLCPFATAQNTQQLIFAGLRSVAQQGQINAVQTDASGNLYLLINQGDGVRLLKTDPTATNILAQSLLGSKGDIGLAMAQDPAGNLYITGTTTSTTLTATTGSAVPNRTDTSTQSFVAKYTAALTNVFVTFTGGSKIAASGISATADSVFVTGVTYATNLPVTANGIQQTPASGSSANGFIERFSATGTTLVYATYLTGANGDTNPTAILADASDNAYITGSTSATGFPTIAALVPAVLSNPSGFLTKLTPAGDAITFSTFIPGPGLTSIALDSSAQNLLLTGSVALGQFPIDTAQSPIATTQYQSLLRISLDGTTVRNGTLLTPGTTSFVTPVAAGGAWITTALTSPLFPIAPLAATGTIAAEHLTAAFAVDQTARFGGTPNQSAAYASLPAIPTSLAVDPSSNLLIAGAIQPTASASLLPTETYDLPLRNAPTTAFPSTTTSTAQPSGSCNGSACAGSAAYLAKLSPTPAAALSLSVADAPFLVLRNLGSSPATALTLTSTGSAITSNCPTILAPGAECDALLTNTTAGTVTAASSTDSQTAAIPAYKAPTATIVFYPKELDFGIQTSTSAPAQRTITVTNLGTTSQTFASIIDSNSKTASPFTELSSDCTLNNAITSKVLAPGGTCHITLGLTAYAAATSDGPLTANWLIGTRDVALTGFSQAASLSPSATEIDFGTQYTNGLRLPRYLFLSNASAASITHAALTLPTGSPFTLTDTCPSTLLSASICRIRIDYLAPTTTSTDSATLALDQGISVLLTGKTLPPHGVIGTTVNPNLAVTPTSITFANTVPVTSASTENQTVTIYNTGPTPFTLALALSGDFTDVTSCPATLPGNSSCAVALTFVPSQPGLRQGLLAITAGTGTSPAYVNISATATSILPANNGTLNLGNTPIGQPTVQFYKISQPFNTVTATTTGPYTATLIEDTGYGPGQPPASAYSTTASGSCHNCYLAVRFTPTAAGTQTGTLTLTSSGGGSAYILTLTGTGTALTGLILSPTTQNFGPIPVHSTSGTIPFTLTNLTGASSVLTAPTTTGDYSIPSQTCAGTLATGSSCTIQVAFDPTATGTRPGTLTLSTVSATLTGTGSPDPGISLNPTALTFSNPTTQQAVTVTNTGSTTVQVATPTTSTAQFASTSTCTTLAPAASCTIAVTFHPAAATATDTLAIPIGTTTYTVSLIGTYTASSAGLVVNPGVANYGPQPVFTQSSPRNFTITNATNTTQPLNVIIPRQYVLVGQPCTTLAPGATCTFTVAFLPLTNGDAPGSIVVQSGTLSTIAYAEAYGIGSGSLTLTGGLIVNGSFNFGQVTSGQTTTQTFTATNTSNNAITIRRVTSPPPFLSTTTCGATLAPAATCTITVTYTPLNQVTTGTASPTSNTDAGTLTIESDAASSPTLLNLTGQAGPTQVTSPANTGPLATFTLSQGSLTFATTTVGNPTAAQTVTLTNTGNVNLTLRALGTTTDFTATSNCTTLTPGASCTLSITSTPQTAGTHIASLEIASTAATSLEFISLSSTANPSPLTLNPTALNFGSVIVATPSTLPLQLTNTGATPITFTSITASGDYSAAPGSCPTALVPGQSCTLQVTFTPTTTGSRPGTLSIASTASATPITATLTGIGIQSQLVVTPTALAFGPLVLGASANLSLTLTNNGSAPITALTLKPTGDYAVTLPCPATLAPAATCTAQITFTPTSVGARPGTLDITSSDPSSPLAIPLTGTGILAGSFTLTVNGAASASVSVQSGKPATYTLTLTPTGSFAGAVALTCAPIQPAQFATCSLSPSSFTLAGTPQTATATINTITSVGGNVSFAHTTAFLYLLPGVLLLYKRRRLIPALALFFLTLTLTTIGCGSSNSGDFDARYTPPGTYQYQVTATSTSGVQITQTVTLNLTVTSR